MALASSSTKEAETSGLEPPNQGAQKISTKVSAPQASGISSPWGVDDLLQLSDFESSDKVRKIPKHLDVMLYS